MYARWSRRNRALLIVLVIVSIVFLSLYFRESRQGMLHRGQEAGLAVISPLQRAASAVVSPFSHAWRFVRRIGYLSNQNIDLGKENARLRQQLVDRNEMQAESDRLRALVGFKKRHGYSTVAATVIGRPPSNWEQTVIINVGSSQGIKADMPVVVADGLVGQITRVSPWSSEVQLIIDQRSGVGGLIQTTRESGVVQGDINGDLHLDFISRQSRVRVGDVVITSGYGGVFPKGLFLGTVADIREPAYSLFKQIDVHSEVDFSRLEEVLVITNPPRQAASEPGASR